MRRSTRSRPRMAKAVEHAQPDRLAGHGHAQRVDHVADLDPLASDKLPQTRLRRSPRRTAPAPSRSVAQPEPAARRAFPLRSRLSNAFSSYTSCGVVAEELVVVQDVTGRLDAISGRQRRSARSCRVQPARIDRLWDPPRSHAQTAASWRTFWSTGNASHVALLERPQLLRIEAGRCLVDTLEREVLDHLLARELLRLVVQRPAQQQQVVDQRVAAGSRPCGRNRPAPG